MTSAFECIQQAAKCEQMAEDAKTEAERSLGNEDVRTDRRGRAAALNVAVQAAESDKPLSLLEALWND